MPTNPLITVTVLPPRPAVWRMMSTRPRFFRVGLASVGCTGAAGELSTPGGSPSLDKRSNGLWPKACPPSVGMRLRLESFMAGFRSVVQSSELAGAQSVFKLAKVFGQFRLPAQARPRPVRMFEAENFGVQCLARKINLRLRR